MARILVIDDEPAVAATVQIVLRNAGHAVTLAWVGQGGLDAFAAGEFELVIVDLFMPGMDGLELIRTLRQQAPGIPILAMSGFRSRTELARPPDYLDMATKLGANGALAKPFKPADLLAAVDACLVNG